MPEDRLSMRLDEATKRRLRALATNLELPQAAIVRRAIRELAEKLGVERTHDAKR